MEILNVKLNGFRNIVGTTLKLSDLTTVVGFNNYGKSNLLDGIEFAIDFITNSKKTKSNMMKHVKSIPINKELQNSNFEFEIEYKTIVKRKSYFVKYAYAFEWIKDNNKGSRIVSETLNIKESQKSKYSNYISRKLNKGKYKSSETGRVDVNIEIESNDLVVNKLSTYDHLYYLDILKELSVFTMNNVGLMDINDIFDSVKIGIGDNHSPETFDFTNGNNICEVVYHLKEYYNEKYLLLENAFKSLIPTIESLEPICVDLSERIENIEDMKEKVPFQIPEKVYEIRIKEIHNNQKTSISRLSCGSKRLFALLTSAIIADINKTALITFEELENSIHPQLFQRLLIILTEITNNCKIVITSHSPYILQYVDLNDLYLSVPNNENQAYFKRLKTTSRKKAYKVAQDFDVSIGDYIFDKMIEAYKDNSEFLLLLESD